MEERVQAANREAFTILTTMMTDPDGFDLEPELIAYANSTGNPVQALLDLTQLLAAHTVSALVTYAGSTDGALELIRDAALAQAMKGDQ